MLNFHENKFTVDIHSADETHSQWSLIVTIWLREWLIINGADGADHLSFLDSTISPKSSSKNNISPTTPTVTTYRCQQWNPPLGIYVKIIA